MMEKIGLGRAWEKIENSWYTGGVKNFLMNVFYVAITILGVVVVSHFGLLFATRAFVRRSVPDLTGMPLAHAIQMAQKSNLNIVVEDSLYVANADKGAVLDQLPHAGVEVKPGRTVHVVINAFGNKMVPVPFVSGLSRRHAKSILDSSLREIERLEYRQDIATNYVIRERYDGQEVTKDSQLVVPAGSGVTLVVGVDRKTSPYTTVPNLDGRSLTVAKSNLWSAGLNVGKVNYLRRLTREQEQYARVVRQSVRGGSRSAWGTTVELWLDIPETEM